MVCSFYLHVLVARCSRIHILPIAAGRLYSSLSIAGMQRLDSQIRRQETGATSGGLQRQESRPGPTLNEGVQRLDTASVYYSSIPASPPPGTGRSGRPNYVPVRYEDESINIDSRDLPVDYYTSPQFYYGGMDDLFMHSMLSCL
eukprot:GHVU01006038.1.p2 GENE.GHVU01006038.1~~GHVU01006038.1.p2  ORF type:complete len:144 (+),score=14.37 GHVU01006038.1:825-1256(+)